MLRINTEFMSFCIGICLFMTLCAESASAATWIVDDDGGPGVDFTDIPSAIAAATAGDMILVRTGLYGPFTIDKGVCVIADTGHHPDLEEEQATISGIPSGQTAKLAGFDMLNLEVTNCDGIVIIDDCRVKEAGETEALRILSCNLVGFYRSEAISRDMGPDGGPSGGGGPYTNAGFFSDSRIILSDSFLHGGDGNAMYKSSGTDGEHGIIAYNCSLFVHATTVEGGRGGDAYDPFEFDGDGGDGGSGFALENCLLELFGTPTHRVKGGIGGSPGLIGMYGEDANAVFANNSTIHYSGVYFQHSSYVATIGGTGNTVVEHDPAIPVITSIGSAQLGTFIEFSLHAPEGSDYLLFYSPLVDVNKVGWLMPHLLLDPAWLFPFTAGVIPAGDVDTIFIGIPHMLDLQGTFLQVQGYMHVVGASTPKLSTVAGFMIR